MSATPICQFEFELSDTGNVKFDRVWAFEGRDEPETPVEQYALRFLDTAGRIVNNQYFPMMFYVYDIGPASELPVWVRATCREEWKTLQIVKDNTVLFQTDIASKICNKDGICNGDENYVACSIDCPSGSQDNICDTVPDGICDPDCLSGDSDCSEEVAKPIATVQEPFVEPKAPSSLLYLIPFGVILLILIGYLIYKKEQG